MNSLSNHELRELLSRLYDKTESEDVFNALEEAGGPFEWTKAWDRKHPPTYVWRGIKAPTVEGIKVEVQNVAEQHVKTLPDFTPVFKCPKCGTASHDDARYARPEPVLPDIDGDYFRSRNYGPSFMNPLAVTEHMVRSCRCGYSTETKTLEDTERLKNVS